MADEVAVRFGRPLLNAKQLTNAQIRAAIEVGRADDKWAADVAMLKRLAYRLEATVRLNAAPECRSAIRALAKQILEVCGDN